MDKLCVLVYSKYSATCNELLDVLKESPVNLSTAIGLVTLCIDNKEIRQRIRRSKNISITMVPTILVVYKDGGAEKYEGKVKVVTWIDEMIKRIVPIQSQQNQHDNYPNTQPNNYPDEQVEQVEQDEQDIQVQQPKPKHVQSRAKQPKSKRDKQLIQRKPQKPKVKNNKKTVSIDELEELTQEDSSSDNQTIEEQTIEEQTIEEKPKEVVNNQQKNASTTKANSLLAAAMAMQKEREPFEQPKRK